MTPSIVTFEDDEDAPCLCGAPLYDGRCSEEDCVCSSEARS